MAVRTVFDLLNQVRGTGRGYATCIGSSRSRSQDNPSISVTSQAYDLINLISLSRTLQCIATHVMDGVSIAASIVGSAGAGVQIAIKLVTLATQISTASERISSMGNDISSHQECCIN